MRTVKEAVNQARTLLKNRAACSLVKPWDGLYIVRCQDNDCYRVGRHYHTALSKEIDGASVIADYVSL